MYDELTCQDHFANAACPADPPDFKSIMFVDVPLTHRRKAPEVPVWKRRFLTHYVTSILKE